MNRDAILSAENRSRTYWALKAPILFTLTLCCSLRPPQPQCGRNHKRGACPTCRSRLLQSRTFHLHMAYSFNMGPCR